MAPDLTAEAVIVEGNTITYVGSEAGALEALPPVRRRSIARDSTCTSTWMPTDPPERCSMRSSVSSVIANCTPLWGTNDNGVYERIYTYLLGAERVDERVMP
ncbi:unannotated protein [freshwater metagenome]|uniref:Unannotated protein n=1 Tax=freshwater metagenome TaxID=449393 RepID=A0A6J7LDM8_9ZZZZ